MRLFVIQATALQAQELEQVGYNWTHLDFPVEAKAQNKSTQILLENTPHGTPPSSPQPGCIPQRAAKSQPAPGGIVSCRAGRSAHQQWPEHLWADPKLIKGGVPFLLG